jgi:hypothetical protein
MTQFDQRNLMCGADSFDPAYREDLTSRGFVLDDTGNNVSNLNRFLGDLTGLYWVWKNTEDTVVGTNQYRRMWDNNEIKKIVFEPDTIYVPSRVPFEESAYDQYVRHHGQYGMDLLFSAVNKNKIDLPHVADLKTVRYLHCNNMFIADREVFNQICQRLFDIVFSLYKGIVHLLPGAPANQTRTIAFLAERILTVMFINFEYYFGKVKIQEVGWSFDPRK